MKDNILKICLLSLATCLSLFFFVSCLLPLVSVSFAATNIDFTYRYAWNDNIGWIDFYSTNNVFVNPAQIKGYADSSVGYIALNCNTTPNGDICGGSTGVWRVYNDGSGNLTGWAWSDAIGWISFDSASAGSPYTYQVSINPGTGDFYGWAWNDNIGWISFNCSNTSTCGTSNYKVSTGWYAGAVNGSLVSSIFDTQIIGGTAINTIMWQGSQPAGTTVKFQIASSNNSSGPWNYIGPDGSSSSYYVPAGPGSPVQINLQYHNNQRYFRYKIFLYSDAAQTASPRVDDVIINWSP